jgi:mediator of RNA polymerase II transcription subunit 6
MEDREDLYFVDPRFLSAGVLDSSNAMEYFSASPFYDKSCNNEILRMQTQFRALDLKSKLSQMVGVFYELIHSNSEQTLFIIRKAHNHGDSRSDTLGIYYIIHGHVYAAPTNHSLYRTRLCEAMWVLSSFVDRMHEKRRKAGLFDAGRPKPVERREDERKELEFMMEVYEDFRSKVGKF